MKASSSRRRGTASYRCGHSICSLIDKQRKKEVGALDMGENCNGKLVIVGWEACLDPVLTTSTVVKCGNILIDSD